MLVLSIFGCGALASTFDSPIAWPNPALQHPGIAHSLPDEGIP